MYYVIIYAVVTLSNFMNRVPGPSHEMIHSDQISE